MFVLDFLFEGVFVILGLLLYVEVEELFVEKLVDILVMFKIVVSMRINYYLLCDKLMGIFYCYICIFKIKL